jgi:hypothetical protein
MGAAFSVSGHLAGHPQVEVIELLEAARVLQNLEMETQQDRTGPSPMMRTTPLPRPALLLGVALSLLQPDGAIAAPSLSPGSFSSGLSRLSGLLRRQSPEPRRAKIDLLRRVVTSHRELRAGGAAVHLPSSDILSDPVASSKRYGDSWTCRESTRLLLRHLEGGGLTLDSVGRRAFRWGQEGWVDYHYFAVDNPRRPTLLVDPTASSNFAADARPGGLLHRFLEEAGQKRGQGVLAARIARRIERGGARGLLVLFGESEVAIYREALERAARMASAAAREAERRR